MIRTKDFPYHVTVRTNNQEFFPIHLDRVWKTFTLEIEKAKKKYNVDIISFVMMSNHIHLILQTPELNIDVFMAYILGQSSKRLNTLATRSNHIFGKRYHWSIIKNEFYFSNVYRYVYQNPVSSGLCKQVQDYPYSTLYYEYHRNPLPFEMKSPEISSDFYIPRSFEARLQWLNETFSKEKKELIEHALKKSVFGLPYGTKIDHFTNENQPKGVRF
ncbi:MAG: transposase [Bdellovibrionales bacterium]|nr:transposase [Bdellovibrionales bacterium]